MKKTLALAVACITIGGTAHAESPVQGLIRTPEIRQSQQKCSDYEIQNILAFNSKVIGSLYKMNMDFNPNGTLDPNVYIELKSSLTRELFSFQDKYETSVKKVILTYPSCTKYVDYEMNKLMGIIHQYPGLENFSVSSY